MMLVEEGKMGLEDPINKYIPDAPDTWKPITIRHLLTHTSGISSKYDEQIDLHRDYTENELTKLIAGNPLDFPPGEKMSYSNAGYVMLGIVIRKATNRFYGDLLEEKIFKELQSTNFLSSKYCCFNSFDREAWKRSVPAPEEDSRQEVLQAAEAISSGY
jgi:CubicO group peptidase (beta-lactamase class C family)